MLPAEEVLQPINEPLKLLYKKMAELTLKKCGSCVAPYSCCSKEYCDMTLDYAKAHGVKFVPNNDNPVPLLGAHGCIVPPELRP